ncbi:MAG TPA: DUF3604 domain-containing protein [Oscillospiraceae bacterium]|nr:DUF3604 domain-containing protein [Oscillospiraceae bacterium]HPF55721.1 DUF3604 domain-containing protein [Clostridiales bacterium]HPK36125.1 DUF3604 domain-containing protein [Oscillospiraceae bacterium]HPR76481.1 DUF3604 domain-containing protein [Oscillospiraceae bacterium]
MEASPLERMINADWTAYRTDLQFEIRFFGTDGTVYEGDGFQVPACTRGNWAFYLTNNGMDIQAPLTLELYALNIAFAVKTQMVDVWQQDYLSLAQGDAEKWELDPTFSGFFKAVRLTLKTGCFESGEQLIVALGSPENPCETYWTATDAFIVLEAVTENERQFVGKKPFEFSITARSRPTIARLLFPTCVNLDSPFRVTCGVFDLCGNLCEEFTGRLKITLTDAVKGLPEELVFLPEDKGNKVIENVRITTPGVYRIAASLPNGRSFESNPCVVGEHDFNIYWGDLHAHGYGDSTMHLMHMNTKKVNPLSRHLQARDIGRFDFSAVGPMSFPATDREYIWDLYKNAVTETEKEGCYIPFLSYEAHPADEDRTVIYQNADEPVPPDMRTDMKQLMKTLYPRRDVLMECHIGGATPKWEHFRPDREDLVEISSAFGNAEWLLHHALSFGYRPAVCGCSDLHLGLMGGPRAVEMSRGRFGKSLNRRDCAYGTGPITAVYAQKLTRNGLFDAMKNKTTYATDGNRIYLSVLLDGKLPGSELTEKSSYQLQCRCHGTEVIEKIDVISGERVIFSWSPDTLDFVGECTIENLPADFVYVRVKQTNKSYAWTTPFYINETCPHWNDGDDFDESKKAEAAKYLKSLQDYLRLEEDAVLFENIEPVGILHETLTSCAVFRCRYKGRYEMMLKWYHEFDRPKLRLDWGSSYCGTRDDEAVYQ